MSAIEDHFGEQSTMTAAEVAAEMRCSTQKVRALAVKHGFGFNLGGSAGWRFTNLDVAGLMLAMRPTPAPTVRRRRRAA